MPDRPTSPSGVPVAHRVALADPDAALLHVAVLGRPAVVMVDQTPLPHSRSLTASSAGLGDALVGHAVPRRLDRAFGRREHGDAGLHGAEVGDADVDAVVAVIGLVAAHVVAAVAARIAVDIVLHDAVRRRRCSRSGGRARRRRTAPRRRGRGPPAGRYAMELLPRSRAATRPARQFAVTSVRSPALTVAGVSVSEPSVFLHLEHVVAGGHRHLPALAVGVGDGLLFSVDVLLGRKEFEEVAAGRGDGENSGVEDDDHLDRRAGLDLEARFGGRRIGRGPHHIFARRQVEGRRRPRSWWR